VKPKDDAYIPCSHAHCGVVKNLNIIACEINIFGIFAIVDCNAEPGLGQVGGSAAIYEKRLLDALS